MSKLRQHQQEVIRRFGAAARHVIAAGSGKAGFQAFGRSVRIVNHEAVIVSALRDLGVWRAEVETRIGHVVISLPVTALRAFDRAAFIGAHLPVGVSCEFEVLRHPLKTKKFTYRARRFLPGTVHKVHINVSLYFGGIK